MPGTKGPGDCEFCNGRGWFSVDMEGTAFYHCEACNTHKTISGPFGTLVVEIKETTDDE
ncbi:MAG: hypothetical protein ACXABD_18040 [Candidatus Thorarchaeota archaeon]|jgi:excinuclease UvrABC ATPase subunit